MRRPYIIAGPCSAESQTQLLSTAKALKEVGVDAFRAGIWKPRTHPGTFEGAGEAGLSWLIEARDLTGLPVGTEVACRTHVEASLNAGLDFVWIGARTTPNPFLVQEIAEALRGAALKVWVKNPVSQDVGLWAGAVERLRACGLNDIGLIFRGFSSFDSNVTRNASQWQQAVGMRARFPELPMLCDPSHMAGERSLVPEMAQRAMNLGMDGLMVESHCDPLSALSDATQQLLPRELGEMMLSLPYRDGETDLCSEKIALLRDRMEEIDEQILSLIASRMEVSREIGELKRDKSIPIIQPRRWEKVLETVRTKASGLGLPEGFAESLYEIIHDASVAQQK